MKITTKAIRRIRKEYETLRIEKDVKRQLAEACPKVLTYSEFIRQLLRVREAYAEQIEVDKKSGYLEYKSRQLLKKKRLEKSKK